MPIPQEALDGNARDVSNPKKNSQCEIYEPLIVKHFDKIMDQFKNINTAIAACNKQIDDLHTLVSAHETSIASCETNITQVQKENKSLKANVNRLETHLKNVIVDSQYE